MHVSRAGHVVVHEPHANGSSVVAAQRVPQSVLPAPHAHAPPAQPENWVGHFMPHALQWSGLVFRSTHVPEHSVKLVLQTHLPEMHSPPSPHALPHMPQLLPSVIGSTHAVPQASCEPGQTHAPSVQVAPAGHAFAHAPQWALFVLVSTHAPSHPVSPPGH